MVYPVGLAQRLRATVRGLFGGGFHRDEMVVVSSSRAVEGESLEVRIAEQVTALEADEKYPPSPYALNMPLSLKHDQFLFRFNELLKEIPYDVNGYISSEFKEKLSAKGVKIFRKNIACYELRTTKGVFLIFTNRHNPHP